MGLVDRETTVGSQPLHLEHPRLGSKWLIGYLLLGALAVALAWLLPGFQLTLLASWLIYGLSALSLDLVWGYGGIFSFGQTAFFGLAAYVYGVLAINWLRPVGDTFAPILVAAVLGGGLFAALLGYFLFYSRIGDVQIAIITYAVTLVLLTVATGLQVRIGRAVVGGENGMTGIPGLVWGLPGSPDKEFKAPELYLVVIVVSLALYGGLQVLMRAPFGRIIRGMRVNEVRTELLGYDIRAYRLVTFALGGTIAGLAGALRAAWGNFIAPPVFDLTGAALVVIWVLVGGRGTLIGAFVGAILVSALSYWLGGSAGSGQATLILGVILVLAVLFFPGGVVGTVSRGWNWLRRSLPGSFRAIQPAAPETPARSSPETAPAVTVHAPDGAQADTPVALQTVNVVKYFGGLQAVAGVSLAFRANRVYCLIGPNGAGKSTYFNLLVGRYRPNAGRVLYLGQDITYWEPHRRVRAGIGIKLQVASIYGELPVRENVWLAAYAHQRSTVKAEASCDEILARIGLADKGAELAGNLSHGEQQWLEIGMVTALFPKVILLDEPTAGMTREETARTAQIVEQLAQTATVIIVEHDMDFVRRLGVSVEVFHQGRVFATGTVDDLRSNEAVLDIYLGRHGHH